MTTAIRKLVEERKILGAELTFYFQNDVSKTDFNKMKKKIYRYINVSHYESSVVFFLSRKQIRAIITYEAPHYDSIEQVIEYEVSHLRRLIDSHDQEATYGWSY